MQDERLLIVCVQFSTMQGHERDTWYDTDDRIDFTNSKGLVGVGLPAWGPRQTSRTTSGGSPRGHDGNVITQ